MPDFYYSTTTPNWCSPPGDCSAFRHLRRYVLSLWRIRVSYGGGGEGGHWDPPTPEICHNFLNCYYRIYNTITKYSIIIGLSFNLTFLVLKVQNFVIYKTLVSAPTCVRCTHWHFPLPGKNPVWKPSGSAQLSVANKSCFCRNDSRQLLITLTSILHAYTHVF